MSAKRRTPTSGQVFVGFMTVLTFAYMLASAALCLVGGVSFMVGGVTGGFDFWSLLGGVLLFAFGAVFSVLVVGSIAEMVREEREHKRQQEEVASLRLVRARRRVIDATTLMPIKEANRR